MQEEAEEVAKLRRELATLKTREALLGVDGYEAIARFRLVESFASKASRWLLDVDKYAEFHQPSLLVKTRKISELQELAAVLYEHRLISAPQGAKLVELDALFRSVREGHQADWPLCNDSDLDGDFFGGLEEAPKQAMTSLVEVCCFLNTKVGDASVFDFPRTSSHTAVMPEHAF
jgi:hypothetical protein